MMDLPVIKRGKHGARPMLDGHRARARTICYFSRRSWTALPLFEQENTTSELWPASNALA